MTAYCTYAEVLAMSGTVYPQATVEALIVFADRDLNARLKAKGHAADYADDDLKEAGLNLAMVRLATRMRMDNTKPNSLSLPGGLTMSDSVDKMIEGYQAKAAEKVQNYVEAHTSSGSGYERADRVDQDMIDLRLNQLTMPTYRGDE